jgi:thiamine pyrophosphate-dependent acetolactate synthase large subunit-like protein
MGAKAADVLVEALVGHWGVRHVFGLPGDGINGIMEALRKRQDGVASIQVRHEESAALAACGYAKFTGGLGVCLATSGRGAIHLLNGLYDAKLDGASVLAPTGQTYTDLIGTHYQQQVSLLHLFSDGASTTTRFVRRRTVEAAVHEAAKAALSRHGVAHISFPIDLQEEAAPDVRLLEGKYAKTPVGHVGATRTSPAPLPPLEAVERAAELLNAGSRVALLGDGAFSMLMAEVLTAVKYRLPIVVILRNDYLGQIRWEQMAFMGYPEYGVELHNPRSFAEWAVNCGAQGFHVRRPEELSPAFEAAFDNTELPTVVECDVDLFEAPLPPKVAMEHASNMMKAFARGQPNRVRIALTMFRQKLDEVLVQGIGPVPGPKGAAREEV